MHPRGLMWSFFLIVQIYLIGRYVEGLFVRINTKKILSVHSDIGLCAQNMSIIINSIIGINAWSKWSLKEENIWFNMISSNFCISYFILKKFWNDNSCDLQLRTKWDNGNIILELIYQFKSLCGVGGVYNRATYL